jgi:hypothetical protein
MVYIPTALLQAVKMLMAGSFAYYEQTFNSLAPISFTKICDTFSNFVFL